MTQQNPIKIIRAVLAGLALTLLLAGCGGGSGGGSPGETTPEETDPGTADEGTTITFIQLNDLHAHLQPHTDARTVDGAIQYVERGGLARIAGMIEAIRGETPHSVLMNIGDTYHGGVEALYTQGNAIVAPVNALGVDVGVPGNWDFAYGPGVTRARYTGDTTLLAPGNAAIERPNFPNLAANITYALPPRAGEPFLPPTLLKEVGGVTVGFIGLSSDIVPRMHSALAFGLRFLQAEQDYVELVDRHSAELRAQGAEVVVVMSELGIHKDLRLADVVAPGAVDVFFSAHTHEATHEPLLSTSGAWVVEAGGDTYLGRMDITVAQGRVQERRWQLLDVDATAPSSAQVAALVEQARAPFLEPAVDLALPGPGGDLRLSQPIDTVIGHSDIALHRRGALQNGFNQAFTAMLRSYAGTDVAMTPGFRFDSVIAAGGVNYEDPAVVAGRITVEDAYRYFPVPFSLATAEVSAARLREIFEQNLSAVFSQDTFAHSGGWFDGYSGVQLQVDLARPDGERVLAAQLDDGTPLDGNTVVRVAGCVRPFAPAADDTLCSYPGFSQVQALTDPATGQAWSAVDFFIHGVQQGWLPSTPAADAVVDDNQTPLWPQAPYYQPLYGAR